MVELMVLNEPKSSEAHSLIDEGKRWAGQETLKTTDF